jgi:hypothetical protein
MHQLFEEGAVADDSLVFAYEPGLMDSHIGDFI